MLEEILLLNKNVNTSKKRR